MNRNDTNTDARNNAVWSEILKLAIRAGRDDIMRKILEDNKCTVTLEHLFCIPAQEPIVLTESSLKSKFPSLKSKFPNEYDQIKSLISNTHIVSENTHPVPELSMSFKQEYLLIPLLNKLDPENLKKEILSFIDNFKMPIELSHDGLIYQNGHINYIKDLLDLMRYGEKVSERIISDLSLSERHLTSPSDLDESTGPKQDSTIQHMQNSLENLKYEKKPETDETRRLQEIIKPYRLAIGSEINEEHLKMQLEMLKHPNVKQIKKIWVRNLNSLFYNLLAIKPRNEDTETIENIDRIILDNLEIVLQESIKEALDGDTSFLKEILKVFEKVSKHVSEKSKNNKKEDDLLEKSKDALQKELAKFQSSLSKGILKKFENLAVNTFKNTFENHRDKDDLIERNIIENSLLNAIKNTSEEKTSNEDETSSEEKTSNEDETSSEEKTSNEDETSSGDKTLSHLLSATKQIERIALFSDQANVNSEKVGLDFLKLLEFAISITIKSGNLNSGSNRLLFAILFKASNELLWKKPKEALQAFRYHDENMCIPNYLYKSDSTITFISSLQDEKINPDACILKEMLLEILFYEITAYRKEEPFAKSVLLNHFLKNLFKKLGEEDVKKVFTEGDSKNTENQIKQYKKKLSYVLDFALRYNHPLPEGRTLKSMLTSVLRLEMYRSHENSLPDDTSLNSFLESLCEVLDKTNEHEIKEMFETETEELIDEYKKKSASSETISLLEKVKSYSIIPDSSSEVDQKQDRIERNPSISDSSLFNRKDSDKEANETENQEQFDQTVVASNP